MIKALYFLSKYFAILKTFPSIEAHVITLRESQQNQTLAATEVKERCEAKRKSKPFWKRRVQIQVCSRRQVRISWYLFSFKLLAFLFTEEKHMDLCFLCSNYGI